MYKLKNKYGYHLKNCFDTGGTATQSVNSISNVVPIWGQVFQATRSVSGGISGDGTSVGRNSAAAVLSPSSGVTSAMDDGDNEGAFISAINPIAGAKLSADRNRKKEAQAQFEYEGRLRDAQQRGSASTLANYPRSGVEMSGYYAKYGGKILKYNNGGDVPTWLTNSLAENDEVTMSPTAPVTDGNGEVNKLASNVAQFKGDEHSDPSGGIGFNATSDTKIYSDKLRTPDGLTYAKQAELFGKQKGKFEAKLKEATSEAASNTAKRMIERLETQLHYLFEEQEQLKTK